MSRTGTDKETRGDEYCLKRTDFETCRKSVWSPERRERLVSPIGDRLRVTRVRVVRKRLSQADRRRRTVTKKAHSERKTRASIRTNPVLSKAILRMSPIRRPRNRQSLTPRRSCIVLPLLAKRLIRSFSLQNRSLREESRQKVVKIETQTAPDAE